MDQTPNLRLPYLMPAQAQKHVTHNEALRALDAIMQVGVADRDLAAPPGSPADGARYIVAAGATGAWVGQSDKIAAWQDGAWAFYAPAAGWLAWVADEARLLAWNGASWVIASGSSINPAAMVGINTTADTTNRLAVKSDAALFSHDDVTPGTGSIQVKYNKKLTGDTAAFLFQTNFSGRAEVGLTGDDNLHFKVSADGSTWTEAIVVDRTTGYVGFNGNTAPTAPLDVRQTSGTVPPRVVGDGIAANWQSNAYGTTQVPGTNSRRARGSLASPSAVQSGDVLGRFSSLGYGATAFATTARASLEFLASENYTDTAHGTRARILTTLTGATSQVSRVEIDASGNLTPGADNAYTCGSSALRFSAIWAANGTIQTSDARDKNVAARIAGATAAAAIDAIEPIMFRWKVGSNELRQSATETVIDPETGEAVPKVEIVPKPGNRLHAGFLAQEVKAAMDAAGVDFGVWGLEDVHDPDSRQWLRPDQLIPVLWAALRQTRSELAALRSAPAG